MATVSASRPKSGSAAGPGPVRVLLWATLFGLLGIVATGIGIGLGLRFLTTVGWSVMTVVGIVALAVGLGLLGLAAVRSWRATPGWWRVALLPLALVALVGGYAVTNGVMATVVVPTPLASETPAFPVALREVAVPTGDEVVLSAWWAPPRNGAVVVLLHGAGENREATLRQGAVLAEAGYGVLLLDARGHGRSGGRGMDFGWYGDRDASAALEFVSGEPGVARGRIALLGLSMGGEEAIGAAASTGARVVVAEGATHRTAADKAAWLPRSVPGALQRGIDAVSYGVVDALTPASPPAPLADAVAAATATRFLLLAAQRRPDEERAAEVLRAAAPGRVDVWTVPGADHTGGLGAAPAEWRARVLGFLGTTLG